MTTSPKQYLAYHPDSMKAPYLALTDISQHMTRYKTVLPRKQRPSVTSFNIESNEGATIWILNVTP